MHLDTKRRLCRRPAEPPSDSLSPLPLSVTGGESKSWAEPPMSSAGAVSRIERLFGGERRSGQTSIFGLGKKSALNIKARRLLGDGDPIAEALHGVASRRVWAAAGFLMGTTA